MLTYNKRAHFRRNFRIGEATAKPFAVSRTVELSRASNFVTFRKLTGVVLNELNSAAVDRQRDKRHV
jgi:hypothetical protein